MDLLCKDVLLEILEYSRIEEYAILRLTGLFFKEFIDETTPFLDIYRKIKENNIILNGKERLFYRFCSLRMFDYAKFIHDKSRLNLFMLIDGVYFKYCNLYDSEITKNILAIRGFDVSQYDFLKEENYSKVVNFLKNFEESISVHTSLDDYLLLHARNKDENLEKIQMACLFGNKLNLCIIDAIKLCCDRRKYDSMKYLLNFTDNYYEHSISNYFYSLCREKTVCEVKMIIENFKLKRKFIYVGFLESLLKNNLNVSKYLFSIINSTHLDIENQCSKEYIISILEKINKEDIRQAFMLSFMNGNRDVSDTLFSILDVDSLNIIMKNNTFLNFIVKRTNVIDEILSKNFGENALLALISYACLKDEIHAVEYLFNKLYVDSSAVNPLIIECCALGNYGVVRFLNRIYNFPLTVRIKCFAKCLENRHFRMLGFFSRRDEKQLIQYLRKNIRTLELNEIFKDACYENNLKVVKCIFKITKLKKKTLNQAVIICFREGCLEVCEFIISFHKISPQILNKCFLESCKYGYANLENLALKIGPIDGKIINEGVALKCQDLD